LIIPEIDYVSGQKEYKKNIAKFFKFVKGQSSFVICVRSEVTANDFTGVQTFCVIEVGLPLIPVRDLDQIPQQVQQIFLSDPSKNRINPFKFGLSKSTDSTKLNINDREIIKVLQTIPGLGDKKANQILEKYNSLQEIVKADQDQLAKVVGPGSANAIWSYLNPK